MSSFTSELKEQARTLKFWCVIIIGAILLTASSVSLLRSGSDGDNGTVSDSVLPSAPEPVVSESQPLEPVSVWTGWQQAKTAADTVLYAQADETSQQSASLAAGTGCVVTQREEDWAFVRSSTLSGWTHYSGLTSAGDVYIADPAIGSQPAPLSDDAAAAVGAIAKKYRSVGLTLALIDGGKVAYTYEYGWADKKAEIPMSVNSKIRIASVSKVFTTMNALAARDLGALTLDQPVGDILGYEVSNKDYPDTPVTLRHLMTHTSSLYDSGVKYSIKKGLTNKGNYDSEKPGSAEAWRYNNFAAGVVGAVTEKALGVTLLDFSRSYFFDSMGIDAAFHAKTITDRDSIACLYMDGKLYRNIKEQVNRTFHDTPGQNYAAYFGALTISAADMASVLTILINDGQYDGKYYLSPESVAEMEQAAFSVKGFEQCLMLRKKSDMYAGRTLYYHTGNAQGVRSFISYDKETGDGLVVIATGINGEAKDDREIYSVCGDIADYCYSNIL